MSGTGTELEVHQDGMRLEDAAPAPVERPDVPAEGEAAPAKPRNPRDEQMAAIARNYEERQRGHEIAFAEELARDARERDPPAETPVESTEPAGTPGAEHADASARTPEPARAPAATEAAPHGARQGTGAVSSPPPGLRTVTLQGQQFQVTEDQFSRLAEIGAMANMAMQQPQGQPQGHGWQQPGHQPQAAPPQAYARQNGHAQPAPSGPIIDHDAASAIVQRLAYGGQEDGIAAVQELATHVAQQLQARSPQIDPAQIRAEAVQQALQTITTNQNLERIGVEYPEVFNDRSRAYLAAIHLMELRQRDAALGQQTPDLQLYREACNMVRGAMGVPGNGQQPQSGGNGQQSNASQAAQPGVRVNPDRLERKRAAPSNPAAVSRAASLGPEAQRPPSASEVVDWMRKSRHQMPMR